MTTEISDNEWQLLEWLAVDKGQYGECCGPTLDSIIKKGLAEVRLGREHQSGFIAQGDTIHYQAVALTAAGRRVVANAILRE